MGNPDPWSSPDEVHVGSQSDSSRRAVLLAGAAALTAGTSFSAANSRDETAPTNVLGKNFNGKDTMQPGVALKGFDYGRITTAGAVIFKFRPGHFGDEK